MLNSKQIAAAVFAVAATLVFSNGASAAPITFEDFEGGASGWTDNTTTVGSASFTEFLGRFTGGIGQQNSKTYSLSGTQTLVSISFDFYEIDSWDTEAFRVYVDDVLFSSIAYSHGVNDVPGGIVTNLLPRLNYGFASWPDQTYRYSFDIATTASTLKLGFGSSLNQGISDEAWGVDNVRITSNADAGGVVIPEPASLALFGLGLLGLGMARRRKRA